MKQDSDVRQEPVKLSDISVSILIITLNLKESDDGDTQNYWGFGLCPSSGIKERTRTQRFGNWICFHPQKKIGRCLLCWVP
jgi:hypothetical protein